ncbi:MAG: hypothetical protein VYE27_08930 [Pseudomonadota bacterium]|nr:hypothetical protein [Pseudomonadota bacterium]
MNIVFITGASGNLGRHFSLKLQQRKTFKVILLQRGANTVDSIKWDLQTVNVNWPTLDKKSSYWLIHLAYDWRDKASLENNTNYTGTISLFESFYKSFPKGRIIFFSTTVSSEENKSSYSQNKNEISKWIRANKQVSFQCGIFVDYPSFGQFNLIRFLSRSPIAIIPLKNATVQLSSRDTVLASLIKLITQNTTVRRGENVSCASTPLTLSALHKRVATIMGNPHLLVVNIPYFFAFVILLIPSLFLKNSRLLEKLNGLRFNKETDNNILDHDSINISIQKHLMKIKQRQYILEATLFFHVFVRKQNYFKIVKFYTRELQRINANNFFTVNLISLIPGRSSKLTFYYLLLPFLHRPFIHTYLRSMK